MRPCAGAFRTCGLLRRRAAHSLHREPLEGARLVAHVGRGHLQDHDLSGPGVACQVNVAPAAAVDRPQDGVAIEGRAKLKDRRRRQAVGLLQHVGRIACRQGVHPDDLDRQVVGAAGAVDPFGDRPGRLVQVAGVGQYVGPDGIGPDVVMHPSVVSTNRSPCANGTVQ